MPGQVPKLEFLLGRGAVIIVNIAEMQGFPAPWAFLSLEGDYVFGLQLSFNPFLQFYGIFSIFPY